jgi:hypothetical protein
MWRLAAGRELFAGIPLRQQHKGNWPLLQHARSGMAEFRLRAADIVFYELVQWMVQDASAGRLDR